MSVPAPLLLIDAISIPAFAILQDARIAVANSAALSIFGDQILDRQYWMAIRQPDLLDAIERSIDTSGRAEATFVDTSNASDTRFKAVATPFVEGGEAGTLVCLEDISHLHAAGQMRRDFVANVSHELRTPLTAVMGFIETLQGPARDDQAAQERFLAMMLGEAQRMDRLVDDLLSLSRVEASERQRPLTPVLIADVLDASISSLTLKADAMGTTLISDLSDPTLSVPGDSDQLRQVVNNLLENAIKYGRKGGKVRIEVNAPYYDVSLRCRAVRITVQDDGPGIDPLHVPRLTERFYRVDGHRNRETGGTGLGLAIVKHIVSRHRGRMEIDSTPDKGSRFSVILPA